MTREPSFTLIRQGNRWWASFGHSRHQGPGLRMRTLVHHSHATRQYDHVLNLVKDVPLSGPLGCNDPSGSYAARQVVLYTVHGYVV